MDGLFKETVSCIGGFLNVFQSQRRMFLGALRFLGGCGIVVFSIENLACLAVKASKKMY
jgi:hypothetical protein